MKKTEAVFVRNYILAKQYYKQNGNLRIPPDYVVEVDGKLIYLGAWICNLRSVKSNPDVRIVITKIEEHFLSKIGMEWDIYYTDFLNNYTYLINHSKGLSIRGVLGNASLLEWLHYIQTRYQMRQLSGKRKELYEQNPTLFSIPTLKWEYYYALAQQYYKRNGNLIIFKDLIIDGYNLGKWVKNQRTRFIHGTLSEEQIDRLNQVGMIWSKIEYKFLHTPINNSNKKFYYKKLKDRLDKYLLSTEIQDFKSEEHIKKLNYNFSNYLDTIKK